MGYAENNERLNPLLTDLYQFTMSQVFFDKGIADRESTYYLHWRNPALPESTYSTVAGTEEAIDFLKNFKFTEDDIAYLASMEKKGKKLFTPEFLAHLKNTPLKLDVEALPEGEVQTSPGPVIVIKGPLYQCQLVESALLNIMNRNSMIATRASQLRNVVGDAPLADFGLRRAAASEIGGSRAAYIGGCSATADTDAGRRLGIPVVGTMAHALIMNFQEDAKPNTETELDAFKSYMQSMPHNTVLLVDTYNPYQGIENAIKAAIQMDTPLDGVRLDSGDLVDIAAYAAKRIQEEKGKHPTLFSDTKVFMTDGLNEKKILDIRQKLDALWQKEQGAPFPNILAYGVGTELQNPGPFRNGVYKVCAHQTAHGMETTMKVAGENPLDPSLPSSKASIPAESPDIMRLWKDNKIIADVVVDKALGVEKMLQEGKAVSLEDNKTITMLPPYDKVEMLLKPIFKRNAQGISEYVFDEPKKIELYNGKQVTDLGAIRQFHQERVQALPANVRGIDHTEKPVVLIDPQVQEHRLKIIAKTNAEVAAKPSTITTGDLKTFGGPEQQQNIA